VLPTGHAALAYLCYAGVAILTDRRLPATDALVPLLVASQLPDLVDKPLSYAGLLPSGRSLAHSLLALVVLAVAVGLCCRELGRAVESDRVTRLLAATPGAFAIGYASHLVGDSYRALLAGSYADASFLLYPFVPARTYPNDGVAPWLRLRRIYLEGGTDAVGPVVVGAVALFVGVRVWAYWRREPPAPR
jgi:hypothetical protein